jgi:hypothetical protein
MFPPNEESPKYKGQRLGQRIVPYALAAEQWRIDAFLLLGKCAERGGSSEDLIRMEGSGFNELDSLVAQGPTAE